MRRGCSASRRRKCSSTGCGIWNCGAAWASGSSAWAPCASIRRTRPPPHLDLVNVKHPREVKETIFQAVEQVKNQRRMRTTELVDDGEDELYDDEHDEME